MAAAKSPGLAPDVVVPDDFRRGVANNESEVRQRVRELIAGGADFIKMIATGAVLTSGTTPGASEYTEAEIRAAVEEAAQYGTYRRRPRPRRRRHQARGARRRALDRARLLSRRGRHPP